MFDILDILGITTLMETVKEKVFSKKEAHIAQSVAPVKYSYRPNTFEQYIGQESAKDKIRLTIQLINKGFPKHFLLTGNAGHGKTTMAGIIAKALGFNLNVYVGSSFDINAMQDFLVKNQDSIKPQILFIDELAEVDKKTLTYMLPVIEDFKVNNLDLRKFIFIGATTDKYVVSKRCQPFIDRIACQIQLEDYTANDIKTMLKQYNAQLYKENITEAAYDAVASNTRFCPRIALSTFDLLIGCGDINRVLTMNRIVKNGLDDRDIKILKHLASVGDRAVGEEALSIIANTTRAEYKELIEPYLLRQEFLSRTNKGRVLTTKSKLFLQELT
jgi:Holliday junction DNA helicase RuvB